MKSVTTTNLIYVSILLTNVLREDFGEGRLRCVKSFLFSQQNLLDIWKNLKI